MCDLLILCEWKRKMSTVKTKLNVDSDALKKIKLVAVAYSFVDRDLFPNEEAYKAEKERKLAQGGKFFSAGAPPDV